MIRRIHSPSIPARAPNKLLVPAYMLGVVSLCLLACMGSAWWAARTVADAYLSIP